MFTFLTLVFHTFMYCSFVLSKISLCSHSLNWYFTPSCIAFWCRLRWPFEGAWCSHSLHWYFTPSCIALRCWARMLLTVVLWFHSLHWYLFPSCIAAWCLLSSTCLSAWCPQILQIYLLSVWEELRCIFITPLDTALYLHWSQENIFPVLRLVLNYLRAMKGSQYIMFSVCTNSIIIG